MEDSQNPFYLTEKDYMPEIPSDILEKASYFELGFDKKRTAEDWHEYITGYRGWMESYERQVYLTAEFVGFEKQLAAEYRYMSRLLNEDVSEEENKVTDFILNDLEHNPEEIQLLYQSRKNNNADYLEVLKPFIKTKFDHRERTSA